MPSRRRTTKAAQPRAAAAAGSAVSAATAAAAAAAAEAAAEAAALEAGAGVDAERMGEAAAVVVRGTARTAAAGRPPPHADLQAVASGGDVSACVRETVPLTDVVRTAALVVGTEVQKLCEKLRLTPIAQRRDVVLNFVRTARRLLVQAKVVVAWSREDGGQRNLPLLRACQQLLADVAAQHATLDELRDRLFFFHAGVYPNRSMPLAAGVAAQTLSAGTYSILPRCIPLRGMQPRLPELPLAEAHATMEHALRKKLLHLGLPALRCFSSVRVRDGALHLERRGEYRLVLVVKSAKAASQWHVVGLDVTVQAAPHEWHSGLHLADSHKAAVLSALSTIAATVLHPAVALLQMHNVCHRTSVALQFATLRNQARTTVKHTSWKSCLEIHSLTATGKEAIASSLSTSSASSGLSSSSSFASSTAAAPASSAPTQMQAQTKRHTLTGRKTSVPQHLSVSLVRRSEHHAFIAELHIWASVDGEHSSQDDAGALYVALRPHPSSSSSSSSLSSSSSVSAAGQNAARASRSSSSSALQRAALSTLDTDADTDADAAGNQSAPSTEALWDVQWTQHTVDDALRDGVSFGTILSLAADAVAMHIARTLHAVLSEHEDFEAMVHRAGIVMHPPGDKQHMHSAAVSFQASHHFLEVETLPQRGTFVVLSSSTRVQEHPSVRILQEVLNTELANLWMQDVRHSATVTAATGRASSSRSDSRTGASSSGGKGGRGGSPTPSLRSSASTANPRSMDLVLSAFRSAFNVLLLVDCVRVLRRSLGTVPAFDDFEHIVEQGGSRPGSAGALFSIAEAPLYGVQEEQSAHATTTVTAATPSRETGSYGGRWRVSSCTAHLAVAICHGGKGRGRRRRPPVQKQTETQHDAAAAAAEEGDGEGEGEEFQVLVSLWLGRVTGSHRLSAPKRAVDVPLGSLRLLRSDGAAADHDVGISDNSAHKHIGKTRKNDRKVTRPAQAGPNKEMVVQGGGWAFTDVLEVCAHELSLHASAAEPIATENAFPWSDLVGWCAGLFRHFHLSSALRTLPMVAEPEVQLLASATLRRREDAIKTTPTEPLPKALADASLPGLSQLLRTPHPPDPMWVALPLSSSTQLQQDASASSYSVHCWVRPVVTTAPAATAVVGADVESCSVAEAVLAIDNREPTPIGTSSNGSTSDANGSTSDANGSEPMHLESAPSTAAIGNRLRQIPELAGGEDDSADWNWFLTFELERGIFCRWGVVGDDASLLRVQLLADAQAIFSPASLLPACMSVVSRTAQSVLRGSLEQLAALRTDTHVASAVTWNEALPDRFIVPTAGGSPLHVQAPPPGLLAVMTACIPATSTAYSFALLPCGMAGRTVSGYTEPRPTEQWLRDAESQFNVTLTCFPLGPGSAADAVTGAPDAAPTLSNSSTSFSSTTSSSSSSAAASTEAATAAALSHQNWLTNVVKQSILMCLDDSWRSGAALAHPRPSASQLGSRLASGDNARPQVTPVPSQSPLLGQASQSASRPEALSTAASGTTNAGRDRDPDHWSVRALRHWYDVVLPVFCLVHTVFNMARRMRTLHTGRASMECISESEHNVPAVYDPDAKPRQCIVRTTMGRISNTHGWKCRFYIVLFVRLPMPLVAQELQKLLLRQMAAQQQQTQPQQPLQPNQKLLLALARQVERILPRLSFVTAHICPDAEDEDAPSPEGADTQRPRRERLEFTHCSVQNANVSRIAELPPAKIDAYNASLNTEQLRLALRLAASAQTVAHDALSPNLVRSSTTRHNLLTMEYADRVLVLNNLLSTEMDRALALFK